MGLRGARGLGRISENLDCTLQAAMVAEDVKEPAFYEAVESEPYPREYGERHSARRRGIKFQEVLYENHAAKLRRVLGPMVGLDPETMTVRNMVDEVPNAPLIRRKLSVKELKAMTLEERSKAKSEAEAERGQASRIVRELRFARTRRIMKDLAEGQEPTHLIIEPQLRIWVGPGRSDYVYITPDFMVFHPLLRMYLVGELKSFIVRDNVVDPADINQVRRQAAAQVLALRIMARSLELEDRVLDEAVFVFAQPWGLTPAPPVRDPLKFPVQEVAKAVEVLQKTNAMLKQKKIRPDEPLANLVPDLGTNYKDSCVAKCVMADHCRKRHAGAARLLGDQATDFLGPDMPIERVVALLDGAAPLNDRERELAPLLIEADRLLRLAS